MWLPATAGMVRAQSADAIKLQITPDAGGCITEAALRARIASLHVQAKDADGLELAVDASNEPATLEVRRNEVVVAARRFDALPVRCADRLQTIALVVALAIEHAIAPADDDVADASIVPEAKTEVAVPDDTAAQRPGNSEAAAQAAPIERDGDERERREESSVRTILSVGAAYGLLPELAGTLAAGVELAAAGLRIGLGALVTTEASTALAGGTALTRVAGARAYGCATGQGLALDLQACAGAALGVVSGSGRDYARRADATGTLLAPLLRVAARYPAHGLLSVGLSLEGFVHAVRPELQVSGRAGAASTLPLFGAALSLEGALALP
jgi:hypothetical protein